MKSIGIIRVVAALFLTAAIARAAPLAPQVGDTYEIMRIRESVQQGSDGSSGNSHDKDTIIERVIGVRADGLELEYDLPKTADAADSAGNWQFPARIFKPFNGPAQLLNGPELEQRVDGWLKAAGLSRTACGHWIFTWNAFRIECDPQSAIKIVESFELKPADVREGVSPADPDAVRRARAESDVVTGEIMNKPVSLDAALHERAKKTVSGTISVEFATDPTGGVRRRTMVTKLDIKRPDGRTETQTVTETLERRLVSRRD